MKLPLAGKKILITGASGFLGTYLSEACAKYGGILFGLDSNAPVEPQLWAGFAQSPMEAADFHKLLDGHELDFCFHLAGGASVPLSVREPYADFYRLLPGWAKLLDTLQQGHGQCRTILFSSAAVYGNPESLPITEEFRIQPMSPYGAHKAIAEDLLKLYSRMLPVQGAILRIFSAYGSGLKKQLFWDACGKLKQASLSRKKEVVFYGTGLESRDFIHGADVAEAAILVATAKSSDKCEVFNIGNGKEVTISEAISKLSLHCGDTVKIRFGGEVRAGDPIHWQAEVSKLKKLGYQPGVNLEKGLEEYAKWFASLAP